MKNEKFTVYLASALFTLPEIEHNKKLGQALEENGYNVFLPQEECVGLTDPLSIMSKCIYGVNQSDVVIANLEGTDVDSGTAFECGYAFALKIPVIGVRSDFRQRGDDFGLNCMLSQSVRYLVQESSFDRMLHSILIGLKMIKGD